MNRTEFLKNLKEVTDILESNSILYDVLFDYRNKQEFKNIKILVNDYVDERTLSTLLGVVEKAQGVFTQIRYKEIPVVFIKASDTNWVNAFYFYSGEIVSDAINSIANQMGLSYTDKGLYYTNTRTPILVTNKVFDIFKYFELKINPKLTGFESQEDINEYERNISNFNSITTGFNNIKGIFEFIIDSTYFNANIFTLSDIKQDDFFYEEKLPIYSLFVKAIEPFKIAKMSNYEFPTKDEYLDTIDLYFPEAELLKKYCLQNLDYLKKMDNKG